MKPGTNVNTYSEIQDNSIFVEFGSLYTKGLIVNIT
jgi:hypothetical protein